MAGIMETVTAVAAELSASTGKRWTAGQDDMDSRGGHLFGPDGQEIRIARDWRDKAKLAISGTYPHAWRDYVTGLERVEIGVSEARGAHKIMLEIRGRLLPRYEAERARGRQAFADGREREARTDVAADELRAAAGAGPGHEKPGSSHISLRPSYHRGGWYGNAYVGDGTVNLDLHSIPRDVAIRMLRVLAGSGGAPPGVHCASCDTHSCPDVD